MMGAYSASILRKSGQNGSLSKGATAKFKRDHWGKGIGNPGQTECPLWVKSGHVQCKRACPLYPRKRTFAADSVRHGRNMIDRGTALFVMANTAPLSAPAYSHFTACGLPVRGDDYEL
jgi:hypothetical protein